MKIAIVGAGLAGLSAALTLAEKGIASLLISALPSERAQSVMAEGGINAALNTKGEDDSPQQHYADTLKAAAGLADPQAVAGLTQAAPQLVQRLADLGVQFNRQADGELDLRNFGGQKKKRTAFAKSDTGKQLMTALIDAVRRAEEKGLVTRFPHHEFVTLTLTDSACTGLVVRDTFTNEKLSLAADGVIIATGGLHGLFGHTTGSLANTGAVTAELFRLGLPIVNGEFIQYHPTTVASSGKRMLISEAARGEGGRLWTEKEGRPWYFMEETYPELGNLMPRDVTSREIWKYCQRQPVYLDLTGLPKAVLDHKLAGLVADCQLYLNLDIHRQPIPVEPGIHYFMGGLGVDRNHRLPLAHLYAAGECAAIYHGANRLGGNSLLGAVYGGHVAALSALADGENPYGGRGLAHDQGERATSREELLRLRYILDRSLGVVREEKSLVQGLAILAAFSGNLPRLGKALLLLALARKESRGAHYRSDYTNRDDAHFQKNSVAIFDGTNIQTSYQDIGNGRH